MRTPNRRWLVVAVAAALIFGVLSLYQASDAAPRQQPFGNSLEQRQEQIALLTEISELLKQQNALMREHNALLSSGKLQVVVTLPENPQ